MRPSVPVVTTGTPLVSVLLPVYNGERYLRQALDSVLVQSFRDFELLVVDDGSSDRSGEIIAEYAARDARVRPLPRAHGGLVDTLNAGLEACRGRWVARMDADDICVADRLEAQLAFAERNHGVSVIGSYARYIGETGQVIGLYRLGPTTVEEFGEMVGRGELIQLIHPTILMDREVVVGCGGYDRRFLYAEDLELYNRLAASGHVSLALPEAKLLYRIHGGSFMMRSHLEVFRWARFTREVVLARRKGVEPPGYEEFVRREQAGRWVQRTRLKCGDVGAYFYRRAGVEFGRGNRLGGAIWAGAALCLVPRYTWSKMRKLLPELWPGRVDVQSTPGP